MLKTKIIKILKIIGPLLASFLIICVLFLKFNTGGAAQFTDNYLRPIFGNTIVAFLEKIYFNSTDKILQLTYRGNSNSPLFTDVGIINTTSPIAPLSGLPKINNEGVWFNKNLKISPQKPLIAYTFIRPDIKRPYAFVTLAQIDIGPLELGLTAGTKQPGGPVGNPGNGKIPENIIKSGKLVAAFDGGFQYKDGEYGMIIGEKTYLPLKNGIGTLVGYKDGSLKIMTYNGQNLGQNVEFVRQNCPILIENGQVFAENEGNKKLWGRTINSDIYTWRSGVGLTKDGNLIYAVGNNLSPQSLATALKMAGAENAIQLDINPFWVRFNFFEPDGNGGYKSKTLLKDLKDGSADYLNGYSKDFFYLYQK